MAKYGDLCEQCGEVRCCWEPKEGKDHICASCSNKRWIFYGEKMMRRKAKLLQDVREYAIREGLGQIVGFIDAGMETAQSALAYSKQESRRP